MFSVGDKLFPMDMFLRMLCWFAPAELDIALEPNVCLLYNYDSMKKAIRFFDEKKTWSLMKDKILGGYLMPYVTKVNLFDRLIVIVDGFAGCGAYEDGTVGSPIIICRALEERAEKIKSKAIGIFIEENEDCFAKLKTNLKPYVDKGLAKPVHANFAKIVPRLVTLATGSPMFFYIDPFGIKGLEFEHLEQIFKRVRIRSTEVLVNFSYQAFNREASAYPELAAKVMGGDYYKAVLDDKSLSSAEQEAKIIQLYKSRYAEFFNYVGSCPIMYQDNKKAKYYLIFATSNLEGIKLMNNRMGDVYREFYADGRLFEMLPGDYSRDVAMLESEVLDIISAVGVTNRLSIEKALIPKLFMRYRETDYNACLNQLLKSGRIHSETGRVRITDKTGLSMTTF